MAIMVKIKIRGDLKMAKQTALYQIRQSEANSHTELYRTNKLYESEGWLKKPVKAVLDLLSHFDGYTSLRVLDLGCGIGRNSIAVAQYFLDIDCLIDCVDILEFAIEQLQEYAKVYDVAAHINGITQTLEAFPIKEDSYDLTLAVSALEHVDSKESFVRMQKEIKDGTRKKGAVCFIINSEVREFDSQTHKPLPAQFEVNIPTEELLTLLHQTFSGWEILVSKVKEQCYQIPRDSRIANLHTNVVTFIAIRK